MAIDHERRRLVTESLESSGLQALICFSPAHVLLLSGYCPVMGSSVVVFTRDGKVTVVLPEDELDIATATSDAALVPYRPGTLHRLTTPAEALIEPLRSLSGQLHHNSGEVGVAMGDSAQANPYLSTNHFRYTMSQLAEQISGAPIVAADHLLTNLQAIKTLTEIGRIRHAAQLAKTGFDEAKDAIVAGRNESEVAADIESAFARIANNGFERGHGSFFCMSGPNSTKAAGAYARTRTRVLREGDLVMIHANTMGDGYWTDITRTFVVGAPNPQQQKMVDVIAEAREAALKIIAPGASAKAVDAAARDVLTRHGFGDAFKHGTGHGVGFAAANPNALPRLHPASPDILKQNMTFNVEPAIYIKEVGGMRHCDVVACTNSGSEVLTDF